MEEMIDDFLKNWIIENNIRNTFYAPYHYDAMIAFAKHYHQSKVILDSANVRFLFDFVNEFTDTVIPMEAIEETFKRLNEH